MEADEIRLTMALQKKGRLIDDSLRLLKECGLHVNASRDELFCRVRELPIDILFLRDDDIPELITKDKCDLGIIGRNLLAEFVLTPGNSPEIDTVMPLDFAHCELAIAVPNGRIYNGAKDLAGLRIATSYPALLSDFLRRKGIEATIIHLSGAVELAPRMKIADVICDLVSSGATLSANNLRPVETVLESEALLVRRRGKMAEARERTLSLLLTRLKGVIRAQNSKYIMLNCPRTAVERIAELLPGYGSPTVMELNREGMVALHAVCHEEVFWNTMEKIRAAGGSGILVVPIEKMMD